MQTPSAVRAPAVPANGVIDTLTAGYGAVNRRSWVLLLPLLVDLFLWQGPQVSLSPMLQPLLVRSGEIVRQAAPNAAPASRRGNPATADTTAETAVADFETFRQSLMATTDSTNALGLLARGPLPLPTISGLADGAGVFSFVRGWSDGLALVTGTLFAGAALGALYRGVLAQAVRGEGRAPGPVLARVPRDLARVLGLLLVVIGTFLLLALPVVVVSGAAALMAPALGAIGLLALGIALLAAQVYLFFVFDAIFVSGAGPITAVQRSVSVVRAYPWQSLGFVLLTWLILTGMDRVWEMLVTLAPSAYGVPLAMVGNAYIASGLVAASMIFYKDRAVLLAPLSEAQRTAPTDLTSTETHSVGSPTEPTR